MHHPARSSSLSNLRLSSLRSNRFTSRHRTLLAVMLVLGVMMGALALGQPWSVSSAKGGRERASGLKGSKTAAFLRASILAPVAAPTLGNYPSSTVALSGEVTVTPDAAPTSAVSINVSTSTNFKGTFSADPLTGVVRVTNAHPAGVYTVAVQAFDGGGASTTRTFTLTVQAGTSCAGAPVFTGTTDVSVDAGSRSVAVGDFNNDGKQDIATANYISDTVSIRLGGCIYLDSASYTVSEGAGSLAFAVNRTGDLSGAVSVNYLTTDSSDFLQNCNVINGKATSRCDYVALVGTLHFAAGESSKNLFLSIIDDTYAEGPETFFLSLLIPAGGSVIGGSNTIFSITITDNGNDGSGQANPIDNPTFFVGQHYKDFLGRDPDPLSAGWVAQLNQCAAGDQSCRLTVSQGIYNSPEFRERGYFIYKFYSVALGRKPSYEEFNNDRARVSGFQTQAELEQSKRDFIADFIGRPGFATIYNALSNDAYVQQLLTTAGVSQITIDGIPYDLEGLKLIMAMGNTRGQVLRWFAESPEVTARFLTESTVVMHYFGYLRRDPDAAYQGWIDTLTQTGDSRNVTSGFINSVEYRMRFGPQ